VGSTGPDLGNQTEIQLQFFCGFRSVYLFVCGRKYAYGRKWLKSPSDDKGIDKVHHQRRIGICTPEGTNVPPEGTSITLSQWLVREGLALTSSPMRGPLPSRRKKMQRKTAVECGRVLCCTDKLAALGNERSG
jgi:hypothetical protein